MTKQNSIKTDRELLQMAFKAMDSVNDFSSGSLYGGVFDYEVKTLRAALAQPEPVLEDIEQYRLQMAAISTAAIGYWKQGDGIRPEYDTLALRDVTTLYEKYAALHKTQPEPEPVAYLCENAVGHKYFRWKKPQSVFKPIALYTAPLQRKEWVGLTDEDVVERSNKEVFAEAFARGVAWAELKLKEKNT